MQMLMKENVPYGFGTKGEWKQKFKYFVHMIFCLQGELELDFQ